MGKTWCLPLTLTLLHLLLHHSWWAGSEVQNLWSTDYLTDKQLQNSKTIDDPDKSANKELFHHTVAFLDQLSTRRQRLCDVVRASQDDMNVALHRCGENVGALLLPSAKYVGNLTEIEKNNSQFLLTFRRLNPGTTRDARFKKLLKDLLSATKEMRAVKAQQENMHMTLTKLKAELAAYST